MAENNKYPLRVIPIFAGPIKIGDLRRLPWEWRIGDISLIAFTKERRRLKDWCSGLDSCTACFRKPNTSPLFCFAPTCGRNGRLYTRMQQNFCALLPGPTCALAHVLCPSEPGAASQLNPDLWKHTHRTSTMEKFAHKLEADGSAWCGSLDRSRRARLLSQAR